MMLKPHLGTLLYCYKSLSSILSLAETQFGRPCLNSHGQESVKSWTVLTVVGTIHFDNSEKSISGLKLMNQRDALLYGPDSF